MTVSKADPNFPWWLMTLACAAAGAAAYFYVFVNSCTGEFRFLGAVSSLLFSIPVVLLSLLAALVLPWLVKSLVSMESLSLGKQRWILGCLALIPAVLLIVLGFRDMSPTRRFAKRFHASIPRSLRNITVAGFDSLLAQRWLVAFEVNAEDAERIALGANLMEVPAFDFEANVEKDAFLRTVPRPINASTNVRCFTRVAQSKQSSSWTHFIFDASSSQGWFLVGYQN